MPTLSQIKTGITRLRTKGGASGESLYDLANAYVTASRTVAPRPGTREHLQPGTDNIGLALLNGVFQVFGKPGATVNDSSVKLNILPHPDPESSADLKRIWKAEALMGGLYVVAEWTDGVVQHYWIQGGETWQANHTYLPGQVVVSDAGVPFLPSRMTPAGTTWAPNTELQVGDVVEPTVFNGYAYEVVEAYGTPARTGTTEPSWIAEDGATVTDEADAQGISSRTGGGTTSTVPPGYSNPGGSRPSNT